MQSNLLGKGFVGEKPFFIEYLHHRHRDATRGQDLNTALINALMLGCPRGIREAAKVVFFSGPATKALPPPPRAQKISQNFLLELKKTGFFY